MDPFDASILAFLNGLARRSFTFDTAMTVVSQSNLLKGGFLMSLVSWAWFEDRGGAGAEQTRTREILLATIAGSCVAIVVARLLCVTLPFRPRPVEEPLLRFVLPYSAGGGWGRESSFPSDHATLFYELAAGLFLASRRTGVLAFALVTAVICLPRVYLGLHYPTDILGGGLLGVGVAFLATRPWCRRPLGRVGLGWERRSPALFYAVLFLVAFQIGTLFTDVRALAGFASTVVNARLARWSGR